MGENYIKYFGVFDIYLKPETIGENVPDVYRVAVNNCTVLDNYLTVDKTCPIETIGIETVDAFYLVMLPTIMRFNITTASSSTYIPSLKSGGAEQPSLPDNFPDLSTFSDFYSANTAKYSNFSLLVQSSSTTDSTLVRGLTDFGFRARNGIWLSGYIYRTIADDKFYSVYTTLPTRIFISRKNVG